MIMNGFNYHRGLRCMWDSTVFYDFEFRLITVDDLGDGSGVIGHDGVGDG